MSEYMTLQQDGWKISVDPDSGLLCELYTPLGDYNLVDRQGFGGIRYTLQDDDISTDTAFLAYEDRKAAYDRVTVEPGEVRCENQALQAHARFALEADGLTVEASADSPALSQFGVDLNFHFLGKKNGTCVGQLLPSSPYTSASGDRFYCICPVVQVGYCAVVSLTPQMLWRIDYSTYAVGHFINDFQVMSSSDRRFGAEGDKHLSLRVIFAKTLSECYEKIQKIFDCPMILPRVTGSFLDTLTVEVQGQADQVRVQLKDREQSVPVVDGKAVIPRLGYGRHILIPMDGDRAGLDVQVWFGMDVNTLFERSCDTIKKPYHGDDNLCEGMMWCWSMICYMRRTGDLKYLPTVREALKTVMGEGEIPLARQTILPRATEGYPAYHIYQSRRVQEQFNGISILTEMYQLTGEEKYLNFAVESAKTMIREYQQPSGAIVPHTDYTTVCAPIIPLVDLAVLLRERRPADADYFAAAAGKIADFLVKRGLHFPTEGDLSDLNDEEMEDGSISCTALSVLYYCRYLDRRQDYIDFAEQVLQLHENWISYTPDVRMYRSTMRWWETIWEGDGTGPAICAGHAWTLWRAEADYHLGVLTGREDCFEKSFNGFLTNFSKIQEDGTTYACYQPDYFPGGGDPLIRQSLQQLSEADVPKTYALVHDYPAHEDHSLSRYLWVRACATWLKPDGDPHKISE